MRTAPDKKEASVYRRSLDPKGGSMQRVAGLCTALACLLVVAVLAYRPVTAANVQEVLIGEVLPLTGNFASLGQQYLWAGQTVEDIVNNDYPDLAVPLGPGKGFPGLGGAPAKFIFRDDQSRGDLARTIAEQLITVKIGRASCRERGELQSVGVSS